MDQIQTKEVVDSEGMADLLGYAVKTFRNKRPLLHSSYGLPQPLDLPGAPRWRLADALEWLDGRSRGVAYTHSPAQQNKGKGKVGRPCKSAASAPAGGAA